MNDEFKMKDVSSRNVKMCHHAMLRCVIKEL